MKQFIWFLLLGLATLLGLLGVVVLINRYRFRRRLVRECSALRAAAPSTRPLPSLAALPEVVERYRRVAVGNRAAVRTLQLSHRGSFTMSPDAKPLPIRGAQLFTEDPPGFLWWGRIRMSPGVWIDARDMSVAGLGSMRVLLDDTVPIADAQGPTLDEGAALRLLAEMPWYPTALFDQRYVRWRGIDDRRAEATLEFAPGRTVHGVFEFGVEGLPLRMSGERFTDVGERRPWSGVYRDWRLVEGMRVPFEAEVSWELPSGPYRYAHWFVDSMRFDAPETPLEASF